MKAARVLCDAFRVFHDKFICLQATDERNFRVGESDEDLERLGLLVVFMVDAIPTAAPKNVSNLS